MESGLLHVMSVLHGGELVVVDPRLQPNQIVEEIEELGKDYSPRTGR